MGLERVDHTTPWKWPQDGRQAWDGSQWSYWAPNEPDRDIEECARIHVASGLVASYTCDDQFDSLVCEGGEILDI